MIDMISYGSMVQCSKQQQQKYDSTNGTILRNGRYQSKKSATVSMFRLYGEKKIASALHNSITFRVSFSASTAMTIMTWPHRKQFHEIWQRLKWTNLTLVVSQLKTRKIYFRPQKVINIRFETNEKCYRQRRWRWEGEL